MKVKIEKNIYVRDKYRVKRQAFTAGQEVDLFEYDAVLSTNSVINPEDLPQRPKASKRSLATDSRSIATKDLALEPTEVVVRSEETVKEVEAEAPEKVKAEKPKLTVKTPGKAKAKDE